MLVVDMNKDLGGVDVASEERMIAAAKAANCHDYISSFSDGYETKLGERGVTLSGGQKVLENFFVHLSSLFAG